MGIRRGTRGGEESTLYGVKMEAAKTREKRKWAKRQREKEKEMSSGPSFRALKQIQSSAAALF
jgi:hypothetical protein